MVLCYFNSDKIFIIKIKIRMEKDGMNQNGHSSIDSEVPDPRTSMGEHTPEDSNYGRQPRLQSSKSFLIVGSSAMKHHHDQQEFEMIPPVKI